MNSNKNNLRGLKRKFKDKDEEDDPSLNDKPKFKLKDENDKKFNDFSILDISSNFINNDSKNSNEDNDFFTDSSNLNLDKSFDELCNSDQSSHFFNYNSSSYEINSVSFSPSNNLLNNSLQSDDSLNEFEPNQFVFNTDDESSKENVVLDLNFNTNENFLNTTKDENAKTNNENQTFNTFLNSSLNNCYVNRPATPLPQLDFQQSFNQNNTENQESFDSNSFIKTENKFNQQIQNQPSFNSQTNLNNKQLNEENSVFSPLNSFPALIANTKFFNPSSSSLFNAAAIVDTYYSSSNKKIKLEKAKNINHFRYLLFNKSLAKLNKFCNSSDPDIRNSVLVCNTLKRLEKQLRKENIYLHLCPTGLAFVKLKEKQNLDQLDYSNLFFDKNSQIYYELNENEKKNSNQKIENDIKKVTNIDFSNLCIEPYVEFKNNSQIDNFDHKQSSEFKSENFLEKNSTNDENLSYLSSTVTLSTQYYDDEKSKPDSLLGNLLRCESLNDTDPNSNAPNNNKTEWSINTDQNQFSWTNMLNNLTLCKDSNQPSNNQLEQKEDDENLITYMNSYNLFNSTDSNLITDNLFINNNEQTTQNTCVNEEIFSDIDLNLYDFDLLPPTINTSTNKNISTDQNFLIEDQSKNKLFKHSEFSTLNENEDSLSSSSLIGQKSSSSISDQDSSFNDQNSSYQSSSLNLDDQDLSEDSNFNSKLDTNLLFYSDSKSTNFSESAIGLTSINNSNSCCNSISNNKSSTSFTNNQANKITPISS